MFIKCLQKDINTSTSNDETTDTTHNVLSVPTSPPYNDISSLPQQTLHNNPVQTSDTTNNIQLQQDTANVFDNTIFMDELYESEIQNRHIANEIIEEKITNKNI